MKLSNTTTDQEGIRNSEIFYHKFKLNGSTSLCVDGTTPKVFKLEDIAADDFIVTRVDFLVSSDTIIDIEEFAGLPTLTNGIDFAIDGTVNLKTNGDIMLFVSDAGFSTARIGGLSLTVINGHWDLENTFQNGLIANKEDFTITVNDNLSTIKYFEVSVSGIKLN